MFWFLLLSFIVSFLIVFVFFSTPVTLVVSELPVNTKQKKSFVLVLECSVPWHVCLLQYIYIQS